jgi:hypothetical protein
MQTPDEQLLAQALASMPVDRPLCILCGEGEPTFLGTSTIDGVLMGYALCEACCHTPTCFAKVEAHIRGWRMARRRN